MIGASGIGPARSMPEEIAAAFADAPIARITEWLAALAALGQARADEDGRYVAG